MRKCKKCNEIKNLELFENKCRNECKSCRQEWRREYSKRNKVRKYIDCNICGINFEKKSKVLQCSQKCRFLSKIKKTESCWIWKDRKSNAGYGLIYFERRPQAAHRVSYQLFRGPIPKDMIVCHNCPERDNKLCVNPDHLWLGTSKENNEDALKKGLNKRDKNTGMFLGSI